MDIEKIETIDRLSREEVIAIIPQLLSLYSLSESIGTEVATEMMEIQLNNAEKAVRELRDALLTIEEAGRPTFNFSKRGVALYIPAQKSEITLRRAATRDGSYDLYDLSIRFGTEDSSKRKDEVTRILLQASVSFTTHEARESSLQRAAG